MHPGLATLLPFDTRTSTWRSFATISSGVGLFLRITVLLFLSEDILQGGPVLWGGDQIDGQT
ncbi:hypothetical protein B1812_09035 [Methylocystis bryophila]|uniref:Uncharacterized protein n=1 Tax=Methylocystis bryophila TaxID=655015 RepID=A0A1W6MUG3_9HYPH|nr:hypothetical protein B1812_09035 [Methylocystis bryophila]